MTTNAKLNAAEVALGRIRDTLADLLEDQNIGEDEIVGHFATTIPRVHDVAVHALNAIRE